MSHTQKDALPRLLRIGEVAALTRLAEKTLRNRAYRNLRPLPTRVGRRLLWDRDEVLAWVERGDAWVDVTG